MKRTFFTAIALLVTFGINLLSMQVFHRFDLTEGKIYTLTESTKQVVRGLEQDVKVTAFVSQQLPPQAELIRQKLEDYLEEYEVISGGKITLDYIDPANDEKAQELVRFLGIPELNLQVIEKDQRQSVKAYLGVGIYTENTIDPVEEISPPVEGEIADIEITPEGEELAPIEPEEPAEQSIYERIAKKQSIPVVQTFENFEYDLTAALKKVGTTQSKTIGFLEGHGEHMLASGQQQQNMFNQPNPREDYSYREELEKNYFIKTVNTTGDEAIPASIDTLVIAGPTEAFSETTLESIKTFIAGGGNIIFLADGVDVGAGLSATPSTLDFSPLLAEYGVTVAPELVMDTPHMTATFSRGFFNRYSVQYPFWAKIQNLSRTNDITKDLEHYVAPWVSPLTIVETPGVTVEVLAQTSRYAQTQVDTFDLNPEQTISFLGDAGESLPLAATFQKEGEGMLLVVGDSDFAGNQFASQFAENRLFFLNAIDSLTLGNELIQIRSRAVTDRPIGEVSEAEKAIIKWGNTILMPLLFVIYGLIRRYLRNTKKEAVYAAMHG